MSYIPSSSSTAAIITAHHLEGCVFALAASICSAFAFTSIRIIGSDYPPVICAFSIAVFLLLFPLPFGGPLNLHDFLALGDKATAIVASHTLSFFLFLLFLAVHQRLPAGTRGARIRAQHCRRAGGLPLRCHVFARDAFSHANLRVDVGSFEHGCRRSARSIVHTIINRATQ